MNIIRRLALVRPVAALAVTLLAIHLQVSAYADTVGQQPSTQFRSAPSHYPESKRLAIGSLIVIPAAGKADADIRGDYRTRVSVQAATYKGAWYGKEIGFILCFGLALCLLEPDVVWIAEDVGALAGLSKAAIQNRIQAFQDKLAGSIRKSAIPPFTNHDLAMKVYDQIRPFDYTNTRVAREYTSMPENADTMLIVNLDGLEITTDGKFAAISAYAQAVLRDVATRDDLWSESYSYTDFDTLEAWNEDDSAAVAAFLMFAEHHFGEQIALDSLLLVELRQVLRPIATDTATVANPVDWQGRSSTEKPTLGWELILLGDDPYGSWAAQLDQDDISYELHVFDGHRMIYAADEIGKPSYEIESPLPPCRSLRWSVRPHYHFDGHTRVGSWMRYYADPTGNPTNAGASAATEPSYVNGFARLDTACPNR